MEPSVKREGPRRRGLPHPQPAGQAECADGRDVPRIARACRPARARDRKHRPSSCCAARAEVLSAGHDLKDIAAGEKPPKPWFQGETIEALANLPQPVISAVHGHCYTGALELALGGDMIVASANAKFADTHARWALTPVWGMSQRLPRRVGEAKAKK